MTIEWSFRAKTDLQDLHTYISKDSPYYAKQFLERIFMAVEKLATHPTIVTVVHGSRDLSQLESSPWNIL